MTSESLTDKSRLRGTISLVEGACLTLAAAVPLVFDPWSRSPFVLPKLAVVHTGTAVLALAWVLEHWRHGRHGRQPTPALQHLRPYLVPATALFLVSLASTLLAVSPTTSLFGSYERGQGWLTLASYLLLTLLVGTGLRPAGLPDISNTRNPAEASGVQRLFRTLAFVSIPVFLVGVGQAAGLGAEGLVSDSSSAMLSTLGRSNFMAAFLAMTLPLSVGLFWVEKTPLCRSLAGIAMLCSALGIAMSGVRSATIAAALGLAVFWLLTRSSWRQLLAQRGFRYALVALGAVGLALGLWATDTVNTASARIATWQATLKLIMDRPFLGYGPDGLGLVFPSVFPPELVYYQGRSVWIDRAHNFLLDALASLGVLGTVAIFAFLVAVIVPAARRLSIPPISTPDILVAASLSALTAGLVDSVASFWVTTTSITAVLLLASLIALAERSADRPKVKHLSAVSMVLSFTLPLLALLIGAGGSATSILRWSSDRSVRAAELAVQEGLWNEATTAAERALSLWPYEPATFAAVERIKRQIGVANGAPAEAFENAEHHMQQAITLQPSEFRWWWQLAKIRTGRGLQQPGNEMASSWFQRADEAFSKALGLAPNNGSLWADWAAFAERRGDRPLAADRFRKAVDLDSSDTASWLALANIERTRSRAREASSAYQKVVALEPFSLDGWFGLAYLAVDSKDLEESRRTFEQVRRLAPKDPRLRSLYARLQSLEDSLPGKN